MTEPRIPAKASSRLSSSALAAAGSSPGVVSSSVRSRSRRLVSSGQGQDADNLGHLENSGGVSANRFVSPPSAGRPDARPGRDDGPGTVAQFLGDSWSQGWSSVQELAGMFLPAGDDNNGTRALQSPSRSRVPARPHARAREHWSSSAGKTSNAWGPTPPLHKSRLDEVAAGSVAEREAALKAARTASVLESHDGVNGGLDVMGRHKRRNSGEDASANPQPEDCLVYIHHVQPDDTYAGLILRYKCREDVFRKANGLWSRDSIQTRKWLAIPVDACEIRGRPCVEAPSWQCSPQTDLLASTPGVHNESLSGDRTDQDDYFKRCDDAGATESKQAQSEEEPWIHVSWVQIDSFLQPVQIGRVSRQTLGYFPPRRKKSIRTVSSLSTPRQSSEIYVGPPGFAAHCSSRRQSPLGGRPQPSGRPVSFHSCRENDADDSRPAWMRRPGGVGSMGGNMRAPGPDGLPSMSIMGSDIARFGFTSETSGIVESPFEDGRDATSASRHGNGLDRAAAAVEGWLRGALAKRPSTPMIGGRARPTGLSAGHIDSDLIELADTGSEDGKLSTNDVSTAPPDPFSGASGRSDGEGSVNRRPVVTGLGSMRGRQKDD
ncbi:LysM domain-containing protein [Hirsutella rhossiliensis]|uniref:LysM domain-containing protein n=1 Tax=Hirsutella rhossiliensis TaxID=111463 RepID=A0A9P8N053_9HYPO|nr:LysM domain-containing protein [Hirsutella rhossiliensis]KAH0964465.1 LysM domain-containing protein [Hirsutella rhossiliensis]